MENINQELLEKAKQAKSVEELLALAKENKIEMTEEGAKAYYAQLHPASGEIADDELENVAGGGCGGGELMVLPEAGQKVYTSEEYKCPGCGERIATVFGRVPDPVGRVYLMLGCESCENVRTVFASANHINIID